MCSGIIMSKIIIPILLALLPALTFGRDDRKGVNQRELIAVINEFKGEEGFDVVKLGNFATGLAKGVVGIATKIDADPELQDVLKLSKGVRNIAVVDFEDCSDRVKAAFSAKISKMLAKTEMLAEIKDEEDIVRMYGIVSEDSDILQDFILFSQTDCALVCLFGSIPLSTVFKLANS